MKIREAWRQAWAIYRRSPSETFRFLLLELVLRLMALTPLLFLTEPALRWGALLSPVLFVLIVLPARANAAEVMQAACRGKRLFTIELVSFKDYGAKIAQGLKMAALLLLWSLAAIGVSLWLYRVYAGKTVVGQTDFFTLLMAMNNLGGGDMVRGVVYALLMYLALWLPLVFGLAFHSGRRHEKALGGRRVVPGNRGGVVLCWLAGLACCVPFAIAAAILGADTAREVVHSLANIAGGIHLPPVDTKLYLLLAAVVVLLLPALPLRSLLTACYVHGLWEGRE